MTRRQTGGDAFPRPEFGENGMTLRDWFAGQALVGLLAFPGCLEGATTKTSAMAAKIAYETADAMLKERDK